MTAPTKFDRLRAVLFPILDGAPFTPVAQAEVRAILEPNTFVWEYEPPAHLPGPSREDFPLSHLEAVP